MFTQKINDQLSLALVQPSFAKDYLRIITEQRADMARYLPWAAHGKDEAFFLKFIKGALQDYSEGKVMPCAIIYEGQVVGNIFLKDINPNLKKAEIGYWLDTNYRGQGMMTTAAGRLIEMAFDELGLSKVEISAATDNTASRAVPERLGFTLEGIITQAENINGRIVNHALYGLHKSD